MVPPCFKTRRETSLAGLVVFCIIVSVTGNCQDVSPVAASANADARGQRSFESHCAACHGLDGRGGEHAPGIARESAATTLSDRAFIRIIHSGIPAKGMPDFSALGDERITEIVAYLRKLQGTAQSRPVTGDAARGQELFFGKAGCSGCHVVKGRGRFVASDLTDFADHHSPGEIRNAILEPATSTRPLESLTVITRDGRKLAGIVRNEDNFSLQLQGAQGQFYLLVKSQAARIDRAPGPLMPRDYGKRLSSSELDDVVSYIARQAFAGAGASALGETNHARKP